MLTTLTNRVVLVIITALATSVGAYLATAFPAVWRAMCTG